LARHSTGLQALGNTMRSNYKELGLLFLLLGMGAIMFASLIYVFEKEDKESTFKTMFDAYWWAIITMTTVSYAKFKMQVNLQYLWHSRHRYPAFSQKVFSPHPVFRPYVFRFLKIPEASLQY
jgi:hypothetical protein